MTTAAATLRALVDAAPQGLRVDRDGTGALEVWDADDAAIQTYADWQAFLALIKPLLAALPALIDLLDQAADRPDSTCECPGCKLVRLARAIEAGAR